MDKSFAYIERLKLLEHALFNETIHIRDGALLALSSLDDPGAIPYIQRAIQREEVKPLRQDMEQVLKSLEETLFEETRYAVAP
jgi:hypothetical protein